MNDPRGAWQDLPVRAVRPVAFLTDTVSVTASNRPARELRRQEG